MRRHVLFFVHGMGAYVNPDGTADDTWSKDASSALREQYEKYAFLKRKPFDQRFETVHINYDTEIYKLVSRWQSESQAIMGPGMPAAGPARKLVKWLNNGAALDENFAWTHAACVILYRYFPLMRQRIKIHVANQIHQALAPNSDGAVSTWSIVAHSLGTIIVHDVLHAMDATTPNEAGISVLDAMVASAQVLAMIANVSKILETDVKVYDGLLVPQSMVRNQSACYSYINCNNDLDPFVIPKRFDPPASNAAWALAKRNGSYVDISTSNVNELNVHSIRNYLINPDVHIPILEYLCGSGSITEDESREAKAAFHSDAAERARLEQLCAEVQTRVGGDAGASRWGEYAGNFFSLLKRA